MSKTEKQEEENEGKNVLVPEEDNSVVEEPKLTNSSSDEPSSLSPPSIGVGGILSGEGGGTVGKKDFTESEEPI